MADRLIYADKPIEMIDDDIAVLDKIDMSREGYDVCLCTLKMVKQYIKALPTVEAVPLEDYRSMEQTVYKLTQALADAEPTKHGQWRHYEGTLTCSVCHTEIYDDIMELLGDDVPRYCPNCGARMDDPMTEMSFPQTIEEFMEQYKVIDTEQVYSNGVEFVPIFRIKQWLEHQREAQKENEPPLFKATQEAKRRIVNAFMGRKNEVEE